MSVYRRGKKGRWSVRFQFNGVDIDQSAKTNDRATAVRYEQKLRDELHENWSGIENPKRLKTLLRDRLDEYVADYKINHKTGTANAEYSAVHLKRLLGGRLIVAINEDAVTKYQTARIQEGASLATIDNEAGVLFRALGDRGAGLRKRLRDRKAFPKNKDPELVGRAFTVREQDRLFKAAAEEKTPLIYFALELALNGALRNGEILNLRWRQIDFINGFLRVEKSKTRKSRRDVPLNGVLQPAFLKHQAWFVKTFGEPKPNLYVFPSGGASKKRDATKPTSGFDAAWDKVRKAAGVEGRWHDTRHTVISMLAAAGNSRETIKAIAGHVSDAMLDRYCHIAMVTKREAMEGLIEQRDKMRQQEIDEERRLAEQFALYGGGEPKPTTIN